MLRIHRTSGHVEVYDGNKLMEGIVHACRAVMTPLGAAENFALQVEKKVSKSLKRHNAMTSRDLKRLTKNALAAYHPDAAEVYALEEEF